MKKILILLLITSCVIIEQLPEVQYEKLTFGTDSTLEIMTWNIQNFPKSEHTINYAAKIINAIDADVIGLQEIQSDSAFFALVAQLNEIDKNNWSGYRANTDKWNMNLAYIYKTDIIKVKKIYEIYDGDYYAFPRRSLVIEFTFNEELFVIINNHLKAKTGEENRARRIDACQKLDKFIDKYHTD
ncbi:MAG: endonuclease/exonuclease/phosphatase family protein, partial [Candidatus Cloacimonetes bacterium]|nr:endonuclease/exonuclease/phosphatase family protein [Candidatus Cloacimonadota bacterium]